MQNFFGKVICMQENVPHPKSDVNYGVFFEILVQLNLCSKGRDEMLLEILEYASAGLIFEVLLVYLLLRCC